MYWWLRTHCKQRALPHFDTVWSILSFFSIRTFYQIIVATVTVFTSQLYQSIYRIPKIHKITVLGTREDERNSERPYSHHRKRTCSGSTWDRPLKHIQPTSFTRCNDDTLLHLKAKHWPASSGWLVANLPGRCFFPASPSPVQVTDYLTWLPPTSRKREHVPCHLQTARED